MLPVTVSRVVPLWMVIPAAVSLSAIVGWLDFHADEVQGTVLLLIVLTAMLSFAAPRSAWLIGLIMGLSVEVTHFVAKWMGIPQTFPMQPEMGGLLALIPAAIGAGIGYALRRGLTELTVR